MPCTTFEQGSDRIQTKTFMLHMKKCQKIAFESTIETTTVCAYDKNVEVHVHPRTDHKDPDMEQSYNSTLSLNSALGRVGGQRHPFDRFTPGKKTRYTLYRMLCGPQGLSRLVRKISPPPEFDPRTVQPVASRYTDYAILAHVYIRRKEVSV